MKLVLVSLIFWLTHTCLAITVTKTAGSASNVTVAGGISWSSLTNHTANDNAYTTTSADLLTSLSVTNKLYLTNFGFNLPSYATVEGITITMVRRNAQSNKLRDNTAYLVINGTELGPNRASGTVWGSSEQTIVYGGATDLWGFGTSLTHTVVNNSNFGFSLQVRRTTSTGTPSQRPEIDLVQMSITYNTALPIDLLSFEVQLVENGHRVISWATSTETNTKDFEVQRAGSTFDFTTIAQTEAAGFSSNIQQYQVRDIDQIKEEVLYYRLKQNDQNGDHAYFDPVSVVLAPIYELRVFPNPATDYISIAEIEEPMDYEIELRDMNGRVLLTQSLANSNTIELNNFAPQRYLLIVKHLPSSTFRVETIEVH